VLVGIGNGVGDWEAVGEGRPAVRRGEAKKNNQEWDNRAHERCVLATCMSIAIATC